MNPIMTRLVNWVKWLDRIIDPPPKLRPQPEPKPMAILVGPGKRHFDLYRKLLADLNDAEVGVLTKLRDPQVAGPLLARIRALRQETIVEIAPQLGLDVERELKSNNVFHLPSDRTRLH